MAGRRGSVGSPPSPVDYFSSTDEIDITHVRLSSSAERHGAYSSIERYGGNNFELPAVLHVGSPSPLIPNRSAFNSFRRQSVSYSPIVDVSSTGPFLPRRSQSKGLPASKKGSLLSGRRRSKPEAEEIDMSLLGLAMPMGMSSRIFCSNSEGVSWLTIAAFLFTL